MHIRAIKIKNFRALSDIQVEFDKRVNVIVGPNAVGKTTVLEAIRLVKAMLAPRTQNEPTQTLFSLGVASPHLPNRLRLDAIARNPHIPTVISCRYALTDNEFLILETGSEQIAVSLVQSRLGQAFANPGVLIGFLSSPQGKEQLEAANKEIKSVLDRLRISKECHLELTIDKSKGATTTSNQVESNIIAYLDQKLPPDQTLFTYFPADRALPAGEQPVQLGAADATQQLESYNSQPQTKYTRLKNLIFSTFLLGGNTNGRPLNTEFEQIFKGILKGRKLLEIGVNEIGLLSVKIQDTDSGHIFDLDGMSSGEKGLILTFLLIERTVANGGLILLDEPELHLNPAVCKDLLSYLVQEYVVRKNLQVIVCSHSPEILAGAFDNDECGLYHLVSENNLSKVRPQDHRPLSDALRKLGASESDDLLYRGIIFVEGIDDITLLEAGFGSLLKRFKLKDSKGRKEVERVIQFIQAEETSGSDFPVRFFIFDKDDVPTNIKSSKLVRVLQWDRRCLENYLIDLDSISNLLMDSEIVKNPFNNHGEVSKLIKDLAFKQLDEVASRKIYHRFNFESTGIRKEDVKGRYINEISSALFSKLKTVKSQINDIDDSEWEENFKKDAIKERHNLENIWETTWINDCDGKRLIEDLKATTQLKMDIRRFKTRIMKEMALNQTESWKSIRVLLEDLTDTTDL